MNPLAKLAAFVVVLALVFGGALAVGAAVGPIGADAPPTHEPSTHDEPTHRPPVGTDKTQHPGQDGGS